MIRDLLQILFFAMLVRPFVALFIGLRTSGIEHLPKRGRFILVANHASHLDTVTLLSLFPNPRLKDIRPAAAADYFARNAVVAAISRTMFNILPIPRKDFTAENHPVELMRRALETGSSLIVFPEGTRGSGGQLGKFRTGVARVLETQPEVPVVPAYLVNMGRSLPKGEWIPVPFFCEIRIGPPLIPAGEVAEATEQIEQAVRALMSPDPLSF
jgi:1-acyl-sn-glycerol-3-phosphate acyltransferase